MAADRIAKESREVVAERRRGAALANVLLDRVLQVRQRSAGPVADVRAVYAELARDVTELATAIRRGTTAGDFEEQLLRRDEPHTHG